MNFYPPSSLYPTTPLTMDQPGPPVNHPIHAWFRSQQTLQSTDQYIPSTLPSYYASNDLNTLPSTSYTHDRVVNYNREPKVCGQQAISKKITLDFRDERDLTRILETLATIPDMQDIELTLPAASKLELFSMNMVYLQDAFIDGLKVFGHLKRLTIPMEFVTSLLLSHLAKLSNLETLTIIYSPPPRSPHHHQQFPVWNPYTDPAECPGYVFLGHLNFDPRLEGRFGQLLRLDLGAPLSDAAYTRLKILFPNAHICQCRSERRAWWD